MNNLDQNFNNTMIIAAGGTGGHIFPALSLIDKIIDLKLIIITDSRGEIFFKSFFKKNKIAFKNCPLRCPLPRVPIDKVRKK